MQPHTLEVKRDAGAATPAKYSLSSMNALFSMDRAFFVRSIEMILQIMILLLGFVLLVKGADWFVEGAASIARKLGIPQLIVGLTIVAMGTSMPEAAVSITAALNGNAGITIGNVIGSNILNVFLILGITAVITNVAIQKSTLYYEIPFMTAITVVMMIFGKTAASIPFSEA